jgi:hypothetical protein
VVEASSDQREALHIQDYQRVTMLVEGVADLFNSLHAGGLCAVYPRISLRMPRVNSIWNRKR